MQHQNDAVLFPKVISNTEIVQNQDVTLFQI